MNSLFSDQTGCPLAGGGALIKLHFNGWNWFYPGPSDAIVAFLKTLSDGFMIMD
jgi:hypothetical protein